MKRFLFEVFEPLKFVFGDDLIIMSKEIFKQKSTLTDNEICDLVAKIKSLTEKYPEKDSLKITLTFEQILLNY